MQGSGVYLPELDVPEYCNPQNTSVWELHLLKVSLTIRSKEHLDAPYCKLLREKTSHFIITFRNNETFIFFYASTESYSEQVFKKDL